MFISVNQGQILKTQLMWAKFIVLHRNDNRKVVSNGTFHHIVPYVKSHATFNILSTIVLIEVPILVSAFCFDWLINNVRQRRKIIRHINSQWTPSSLMSCSPFKHQGPTKQWK